MRKVAIVALEGVVPFDLATPCEVFGRVRLRDGSAGYRVQVCSASKDVNAGAFSIRTRAGLRSTTRADIVILPGIADISMSIPTNVTKAIRAAAAAGARVASICSGAFVLAATGLLDGRRATTHWLATSELARRYPAIDVDPCVLYVDNGNVLTSAGAAAGLDLCLHLVRRDYGAAVAAEAARLAVMPLERAGGQAQFIAQEPPSPDGASLEPVQRWMQRNLRQSLTLRDIARRAAMSTRTLNRRFRDQIGTTPCQWLVQSRVRRAQHLLETTGDSIEEVAIKAGFGSATTLRARFGRVVGTSPRAYRRAFSSPSGRR